MAAGLRRFPCIRVNMYEWMYICVRVCVNGCRCQSSSSRRVMGIRSLEDCGVGEFLVLLESVDEASSIVGLDLR